MITNNSLQLSFDEGNPLSESAQSDTSTDRFEIRKLTWEDFQGQPDQDEPALASTKWKIGYNYSIQQHDGDFNISIEVWCKIDPTSWVKTKFQELLNHQQCHFQIGMVCALEFKRQAMQYKFTDDYKQEISKLFNTILNEHLEMSKQYDIETLNMLNTAKQRQWDMKIIKILNQLSQYA